jgi:hypothetical protein
LLLIWKVVQFLFPEPETEKLPFLVLQFGCHWQADSVNLALGEEWKQAEKV